jgi:type IV pilus assembly protein PilC
MSYPMIVMVVAALAIIGMMVGIVPKFAKTFDDMGATLPTPTLMLMGISNFVTHYGVVLIILIIGGVILFKKWIKQGTGQRIWHQTVLRIPIMGSIVTANAYAHFSRTLGTLLHNGVSVLPALEIVQKTVGNVVISEEIGKARERITDGSSLSGPLAQGKIFPRLLLDMLAVGEETGALAGSLKHITRRYDSELDRMVQTCTTVLEPLLIVGVAVIIGGMAVALLLPVLTLTDSLHV